MNIKTWGQEPIQTWSSLHKLVKIRKTAIKPAWLLLKLVFEIKQVHTRKVFGIKSHALF